MKMNREISTREVIIKWLNGISIPGSALGIVVVISFQLANVPTLLTLGFTIESRSMVLSSILIHSL